MSKVVLKVENVSKQYRLGQLGTGTMSHDINRWWHKVRGKEDPYLKIGDSNDRSVAGGSEYVWSLKDINFEVEQGEVLGIIGKNGAGKSTLLKILSQVTTPTTGEFKAKGRIASLLEVGTGFHPDLTGRENVFLNGAILGMSKAEIKSKLDEIVDFSGVAKYLDTPVKRYSSGMMVRLGFAVAAHLEPEILIVDEVLAVGDAEFQKKCLGKMKDVSGQGRTVLFVSHNMGAIQSLCTKAICLSNGRIIKDGNIDEVISHYLINNYQNNGLSLVDRIDRVGNGKFKFTGINILNSLGEKVDTIFSGEMVDIEIFYSKDDSVDLSKIVIAVSMLDEYGEYKAMFVSDEMKSRIIENKENKIILKIPSFSIRTGDLAIRLYASISDNSDDDVCDLIDNVVRLKIIPSDFWNVGKTIRPVKIALISGEFVS